MAASAYAFDGEGDSLEIPFDPALQPPLPVTIAAWIQPASGGPSIYPIFANDTSNAGLATFGGVALDLTLVDPGDYRLEAQFGDGGTHTHHKRGETSLDLDTWACVAVVIRGPNDIDLYVNGVDDGGSYGGVGSASGPAYLGGGAAIGRASEDLHFEPFQGAIDEVVFYDRALGPEEIRQLASPCAASAVPSAGPLALGLGALLLGSAGMVVLRRAA